MDTSQNMIDVDAWLIWAAAALTELIAQGYAIQQLNEEEARSLGH